MLQLDFGYSDYVRNAPGEALVPNTVLVPKEGKLPPIGAVVCVNLATQPEYRQWSEGQTGMLSNSAQFGWHFGDFPSVQTLVPTLTTVLDRPTVEVGKLMIMWFAERLSPQQLRELGERRTAG